MIRIHQQATHRFRRRLSASRTSGVELATTSRAHRDAEGCATRSRWVGVAGDPWRGVPMYARPPLDHKWLPRDDSRDAEVTAPVAHVAASACLMLRNLLREENKNKTAILTTIITTIAGVLLFCISIAKA